MVALSGRVPVVKLPWTTGFSPCAPVPLSTSEVEGVVLLTGMTT